MSADQKPSEAGREFAKFLDTRLNSMHASTGPRLLFGERGAAALLFDQHTADRVAAAISKTMAMCSGEALRLRKALEEIRIVVANSGSYGLGTSIDRIAREALEGKREGNG